MGAPGLAWASPVDRRVRNRKVAAAGDFPVGWSGRPAGRHSAGRRPLDSLALAITSALGALALLLFEIPLPRQISLPLLAPLLLLGTGTARRARGLVVLGGVLVEDRAGGRFWSRGAAVVLVEGVFRAAHLTILPTCTPPVDDHCITVGRCATWRWQASGFQS